MNIYDIAKEAGVSPSTVSRVLNCCGNVKQQTRERVQAVIEKQNYIPNTLAQNLSKGATRNIAFIIPDIENPFFSKILHGISDKASEGDYNVFMFGTDESTEKEHSVLETLRKEMICGLIIVPVSETDKKTSDKLKELEKGGIPVVLIDRDVILNQFDGVFSNDEQGAFEAVECLIAEGHKKIGMITGPETSRPGHERFGGYKRALENHGIPLKEDYIISGDFKEEKSYRALNKMLELSDPPTAVFASNNMTTLGCLHCIKERGIKLERDISMIGFDDIPELEYTDLCLSVVKRPIYEMGCEAMRILEQRIHNKKNNIMDDYVIQRSTMKTWLVKRGSEKMK